MRVGLSLTIPGLDAARCVAAALQAGDAGAELLMFGQARHDPLVLAAGAAGRTLTPLAAGIACWDRNAVDLARAAATVAELSARPYRLGIGPGPIRGRTPNSLARMRNYLAEVRAALPAESAVSVVLAAAGPGMAELAGEVTDGVLLSRIHSHRRLRDVLLPAVGRGEARNAAATGPVERAILVRCAVSETEADGLRIIRRAVTENDLPLIDRILAAEGHDLADALRLRQQDRMPDAADAVPEELVRGMALIGPPEACLEQLARYADFDIVSLYPCGDTADAAVSGALELLRHIRRGRVAQLGQ